MADAFLLKNEQVIDLFEIKLNDFEGYFRFHGSKNLDSNVFFQGLEYIFIPCEISSVQYDSQGKQNRPTFSISNINNFITNLIKDRGDLIGHLLRRRKVFTRDLDAINFTDSSKKTLPTQTFVGDLVSESYIINKKNFESKEKVEFLLSNIFDVDGATVPKRKVYNDSCQWHYRGAGCNYGKRLNYNGPSINIKRDENKTLETICDEESIADNLILWLNPDSSRTISNANSYTNQSGEKVSFNQLTTWSNSAGDINDGNSSVILGSSEISLSNVLFFNGQEKNNQGGYISAGKSGAYFTVQGDESPADEYPTSSLSISSKTGQPFNNGITIFYVSALVDKMYTTNGLAKRVLTTNDLNEEFYLGYENESVNSFAYKSSSEKVGLPYRQYLNKLNVYSISCPNTSSEGITTYTENGYKNKFNKGLATFPNFGINIKNGFESECVLYEIIVFNKVLSEEQLNSINAYLYVKYNLSNVSNNNTFDNLPYFLKTKTKNSNEFFSDSQGNLGVPVGDDDDKSFTERTDSSGYKNQTYGLKNLVYKGDYDSNVFYEKGDFVKIDPEINFDFKENYIQNTHELPSKFFVCIKSNRGKNPLNYTDIWIEDKCSKKLTGCSLRYNDNQFQKPFGAFPGTLGYDYRLPGG